MSAATKHGILLLAWLGLAGANAYRALHGNADGWWIEYWAAFAAGVNFTRWTDAP